MFEKKTYLAAAALWDLAHRKALAPEGFTLHGAMWDYFHGEEHRQMEGAALAHDTLVSSINVILSQVLNRAPGEYPAFLLSGNSHVLLEEGVSMVTVERASAPNITLYAGITPELVLFEAFVEPDENQSKADKELRYGFELRYGKARQLILAVQHYKTFGDDALQTLVMRGLTEVLSHHTFTDHQYKCVQHEFERLGTVGQLHPTEVL